MTLLKPGHLALELEASSSMSGAPLEVRRILRMATSSADTRDVLGEASADHARARPAPRQGAHFAPTLALTVTLAVACFAVTMSLLLLAVHPEPGVGGIWFGDQPNQNQRAKTVLYVAAFAVILPLALIAVPRLADAIADGPNAPALGALSALFVATLAATILIVKLSGRLPWGDGLGVVLALVGLWCVGAVAVLARAARPWPRLLRVAGFGSRLSVTAAVLVFGTVLCVTSVESLSALPVAFGAVGVAGVAFVHQRNVAPRLPRRWGPAIDVTIVGLLLLAVPDMVVFETSSAPVNEFFEPGIIQWHHDFLLGPANQLLAGGAVLADDPVSQYGVGSIYFVAGWFQLAPIGYGTFGFLDGVLTALFYVAAYGLLRVAGAGRLLAGSALAVATIALVYNLPHPVGGIPQQGPLRFGLPMGLVLVTVVGTRWPRHARAAGVAALTVLALSSIWSLEAFAYTALTFGAMLAIQAWLLPEGNRLRWLARQAAFAASACVCGHLIFAGMTLAATGQVPDWRQYLAYVDAFLLGGQVGELVYGFERWSPTLAVGAAYAASAAATVLLVWRRSGIMLRERTALIALAGTTAYGIALFSYASNRSATGLLPYLTLPAVLVGALWLSLLLRSQREVRPGVLRGGLAFTLSIAVLLLAAAWPSAGDRFSRSALALARPGGGLSAHVDRLWHPPPIDPRAPEGQRLLLRYMPGQRRALVLLPESPDLAIEILMRSGRANKLPVGDSLEEGFVASARLPALRKAIAQLRPGERLLTDRRGLSVFAKLRADPGIDPLSKPAYAYRLDAWILKQIGKRFRLRTIRRGGEGFIVTELLADRASPRG
jgi:hypothetical protein